MISPLRPADEAERLEALRSYDLLDTLPERSFDDLAALAGHICEAPISLISLVDEKRQWFKAKVGFSPDETGRDISFCGHAILGPELFVVPDAAKDERFADNPLVTGEPKVRFYAGAQLTTAAGKTLGTLCVMDRVPRELNRSQQEALKVLSRQVMAQMELHRQGRELAESAERLRVVTDNARVGLVVINKERRYVYANRAYEDLFGLSGRTVVGKGVAELLGEIYEEQVKARLDRAFTGERVTYDLKRPKGGKDFYYTVRIDPTKADGVVTLVVVVITDATERKEAEEKLREAGLFAQSTIDALSAHLCVLDGTGLILATNEGWRRFAEENPPAAQRVKVGDNYLAVCDAVTGLEAPDARAFAAGVREVMGGGRRDFAMEYPCHSPREKRWFIGRVTRFPGAGSVRVVVAHENITARKQGEIAALRLAAIVEYSDDAIVGKNMDSTVTSWNKGAEKIFGYMAEEMVGTSIMRLIPTDRQEEENLILERIGNGESVEHFETLRQTKSGRLLDVSITVSPIKDALGKVIGVSKVARDITQRKGMETALKASEARYRALFEYAPDGIVIADARSFYLDANASICRMLGYSRGELIGLHATDIVVEDEHQNIEPALKVIKAKSDYHKEWKLKRKDGTEFPAEVIATVMPDGNLLGMIRDATERKRTEARFRRLVDSNAQGVLFWNLNGDILGANDAFLRIVGYTRTELEAGELKWAGMTPPEFADRDRRAMEELVAKGVCSPYEKEYLRKDGSRVPVLLGSAAFEDNANEGVCFVIDLTERKKLEQQFLRAQRMESIGTLAGGIAHDLNNILAPILMSVSMLKDLARNEDDMSLLATLQSSANRGADLVKQVLSFARGVEGQRIPVSLMRLVEDLFQVMRDTFPKSIELRFKPAKEIWTVMGDPTQMHQVLLNLCVNARDAMPSGGTLSICMENVVLDETYAAMNPDSRPGSYVMVKVADTGAGIPPEVRERIFEPFFTTKEVGKGTGLGLSTSLGIVKSHLGFINVYSEPGKGTKFKVYLPANADSAQVEVAATDQMKLPRGHGETVLLVDDEEPIRAVAKRTLERFGYKVLLAVNGAAGVAMYAQHRAEIAVVLTDMAMPIMDGPSMIIALKMMNPRVQIVGSSGLTANADVAAAVGAGVEYFVAKPYTAEALLKMLEKVLKK